MIINLEKPANIVFKSMIQNCKTEKQLKQLIDSEVSKRIDYLYSNGKEAYFNKYEDIAYDTTPISGYERYGVTGNPKT